MKTVYLIESISDPSRPYIGVAKVIEKRLLAHNRGESPHTSKYRPWGLVATVAFEDDQRALDFERYLKSGSGRAFAKKHF